MLTHCRVAQCNGALQWSSTCSITHYAQLYSTSCIQDSLKFLIVIDWAGTYSEQFHKNHIYCRFCLKNETTSCNCTLQAISMTYVSSIPSQTRNTWTELFAAVSSYPQYSSHDFTFEGCKLYVHAGVGCFAQSPSRWCVMALALTIHPIGGPVLTNFKSSNYYSQSLRLKCTSQTETVTIKRFGPSSQRCSVLATRSNTSGRLGYVI